MPGRRAGGAPVSVVRRRLTAISQPSTPLPALAAGPGPARRWCRSGRSGPRPRARPRRRACSPRCAPGSRAGRRRRSARPRLPAPGPGRPCRCHDGGKLDGAGHLGTDERSVGESGLLEPASRAGADTHKRDLRLRARLQPRLVDTAAVGVVGVVRADDLRDPGRGQLVAPDLRQVPGVGAGGDGQFLADHPAPHPVRRPASASPREARRSGRQRSPRTRSRARLSPRTAWFWRSMTVAMAGSVPAGGRRVSCAYDHTYAACGPKGCAE